MAACRFVKKEHLVKKKEIEESYEDESFNEVVVEYLSDCAICTPCGEPLTFRRPFNDDDASSSGYAGYD